MARSPAHKLGQIIGDMLEEAIRPPLVKVAKKHGLYLDSKHPRPARAGKRKVTWTDHRGNHHDLDYVLESGGSENTMGRPRAFLEIAYRRYTKHSRNKAQEIQGAISPLAETYRDDHPFLGVVLGGVFTEASIIQLRSLGFCVLYFPFDLLVKAFKTAGVDAFFNEQTEDDDIQSRIDAYELLSHQDRNKIASTIRRRQKPQIAEFIRELEVSLTRTLDRVIILTLHGNRHEATTVENAIRFIEGYGEGAAVKEFVRYEVNVRYSNGDEIRGQFETKTDAIRFLSRVG